MNFQPRMDTNKHELLFKDEVFQIVGSAMEIANDLGHGFPEKIYENALVVEFKNKGIPFKQQPRFNIQYKNTHLGCFVPDIIAFDEIIIETKVIDKISSQEHGQLLNYLKVTKLKLGLIINFKNTKLEWERIVL